MRFNYIVYGQSLICDRRLPELVAGEGIPFNPPSTIMVGFKSEPHLTHENPVWFLEHAFPDGEVWLQCAKVGERYLLRYPNAADFVLNPLGREILCTYVARGTSDSTLRHILLDGVLPLFMNLLGRDALHATAISTAAGVVAFVGTSGTGKSTLAGSFVRHGDPLFCDDCLVLEQREGFVGIPGYWGLRLWPDSREALRVEGDPQAPRDFKARSFASQSTKLLSREPMPLCRIYQVMRDRGVREPRIEKLSMREAVAQLIQAAYRLDVNDKEMLGRQLRLLSRLAEHCSVKKLMMPNAFSALPEVRKAVLEDLESEI